MSGRAVVVRGPGGSVRVDGSEPPGLEVLRDDLLPVADVCGSADDGWNPAGRMR